MKYIWNIHMKMKPTQACIRLVNRSVLEKVQKKYRKMSEFQMAITQ